MHFGIASKFSLQSLIQYDNQHGGLLLEFKSDTSSRDFCVSRGTPTDSCWMPNSTKLEKIALSKE